MAYARQLSRQFGLQRSRARPPSLPEPKQVGMERYGRPEAVFMILEIIFHVTSINPMPLYSLFLLGEEDHGGPGQFRQYSPLSERQL